MLWEGTILLIEIMIVFTVLVLRRKASGRPAFTLQDRQLFFGQAGVKLYPPRFWFKLSMVAVLCSVVGLMEYAIFAPLGASVLATVQLLTFMGFVHKWLC
jgi:hypothetical protein